MAKRELVESTAPLVGGEFGAQWGEIYAIAREVQAILPLRVYQIGDPALSGAQDLVDLAIEQVWGVSEAGCAAEQADLLEEACNKLVSAHAVLDMLIDKHDDLVLWAALRLLVEAKQRADKLFEGYGNLRTEVSHG